MTHTTLRLFIGKTIADSANIYSKKIRCSQCHEPALDELSTSIDDEGGSLIGSYHDEMLTSGSIQGEAIYSQLNFV